MNRIYPENCKFIFISLATVLLVRESLQMVMSSTARSDLLYGSPVYHKFPLDVSMCLIIIIIIVRLSDSLGRILVPIVTVLQSTQIRAL